MRMVEGNWWRNGKVIKRQIDIGEGDGIVEPWIVPGFDRRSDRPHPFVIPSLKSVAGYDFSNFEQIEIDPRMGAWGRMRKVLPGKPRRCDPEAHFPILVQHIRRAEGVQHSRGAPRSRGAVSHAR